MNKNKTTRFRLDNLVVPVKAFPPDAESIDDLLAPWAAKRCGVPVEAIRHCRVVRSGLDARKKPNLTLNFKLDLDLDQGATPRGARPVEPGEETPTRAMLENIAGNVPPERPLVVGTGPAGLMAAYVLAKAGAKPLLIDRGRDVDQRRLDVETFHRTRKLDENSNYLFGEGGAGAFSDGKLRTNLRDPLVHAMLDLFIAMGAPPEIRHARHPHIGSDRLPEVVKAVRHEIQAAGGDVRWGEKVIDIALRGGRCVGVELDNGDVIEGAPVILATGHGDRDLLKRLVKRGANHRLKGFQVGSRIEHRQAFINQAQYGVEQPPPFVGAADYHLVSRPKKSSVPRTATFCMCPGGVVMPAVTELERLSTNGMSRHARDGEFANSALIVNQEGGRFSDAAEAFGFLDSIEKNCFLAGGGGFVCPAQTAVGFVNGKGGSVPKTSYDMGTTPRRVDRLLPTETVNGLRAAITHFDAMLPGFMANGTMIGTETRVSSPVRFDRDSESGQSSIENLFIIGEAGGAADGIMSAAIDGVKAAKHVLRNP